MTAPGTCSSPSAGRRSGATISWRLVVAAVAVCLVVIAYRVFTGGDAPKHVPELPSTEASAQDVSAVPGPTERIAGMPAGFARTEDGAAAAAASFATAGRDLVTMDPLAVEDAIRQISSAVVADRRVTQMAADIRGLRDALDDGTGPIQYWEIPAAFRVEHFDRDRASVAVWNVSVLSREGIAAPQAGWAITTFDLVWERDDWRIAGADVVVGPAPILNDSAQPATAAQLAGDLDGFEPIVPQPHVKPAG